MRVYYLSFRSVTFGQQAERLLRSAGVSCSLRRSPRWMEEQGCGYALRLRTEEIDPVTQLLRDHQIPMRRVYVISVSDSHFVSSNSSSAIFRSMGVVTFRFRSSPSTILIFMPSRSTAEQSSVT